MEKNLKLTCELESGAEKTALIKFNANHWLRLLRSLFCVVLMAVGFCGSAIAACTPIVAPVGQVSKIGNSLGSVGLGSTVLLSRSTQATNEIVNKTTYKVTLNNCTDVSSFSGSLSIGGASNVGTNDSIRIFIGGGTEAEPFQTQCAGLFTGKCEGSGGGTTGTTGIGLEYAISVSGTTAPAALAACTISRSSSTFSWTPANCSSITVTHIHTMIRIKNLAPVGTLNSGFVLKTGVMSMNLSNKGIVDLSTQPGMLTKFTYLTPTCSVSMPSTVNLGEVPLDTVQNATPGNQVGTWQNMPISLNNCSTDAVQSFDKLFTWTFAKPAADALSMLNDGGSATGVSAQIRVNQSLKNVDGSTNSSGIIKSGLTYEGPLKGSVAITPIYSVGFIRNGEAVSAGSFSSNAILSLDYR